MKRFIRNKITGDYFTDGAWNRDYSVATDFKDTMSVLHAARKLDRTNLEEILMVKDRPSGLDVALALYVPVWGTANR